MALVAGDHRFLEDYPDISFSVEEDVVQEEAEEMVLLRIEEDPEDEESNLTDQKKLSDQMSSTRFHQSFLGFSQSSPDLLRSPSPVGLNSSSLSSPVESPLPSPALSPMSSPVTTRSDFEGARPKTKVHKAKMSAREQAEQEASEACHWLKAAGFPQYVQMFENCQFPIDITSVEKDHDFLDRDSIQSLFRRLDTLNKCSSMKVETASHRTCDDSEDEDQCALSKIWKYERRSQRWSRVDPTDILTALGDVTSLLPKSKVSSSSQDSVLEDSNDHNHNNKTPAAAASSPAAKDTTSPLPAGGDPGHRAEVKTPADTRSPAVAMAAPRGTLMEISPAVTEQQQQQRERGKDSQRLKGPKELLKKFGSFKGRKANSLKRWKPAEGVTISGPILNSSDALQKKVELFNCRDIPPVGTDNYITRSAVTASLQTNGVTAQPPPLGEEPAPGPAAHTARGDSCVKLTDSQKKNLVATSDCDKSKRQAVIFSDSSEESDDGTGVPPAPGAHSTPRKVSHSKDDTFILHPSVSAGSNVASYGLKPAKRDMIETSGGGVINFRTGSFNMGSDSCRQNGQGGRQNHPPPRSRAASDTHDIYRFISVYDNVPADHDSAHPSHELLELDQAQEELNREINRLNNFGSGSNLATADSQSRPKSQITLETQEVLTSIHQLLRSEEEQFDFEEINAEVERILHGISESINQIDETFLTGGDNSSAVSPLPSPGVPRSCQFGDADLCNSTSTSCQDTSEADTAGSHEDEVHDDQINTSVKLRDRRDSGVGSTLSRCASGRPRMRWHSFMKSHRPSITSRAFQICNLSAGQFMVLRKLSLLKLTALMERYSVTNRLWSGWSRVMPRLKWKSKAPDYRDRAVFGVPLHVILQRTGQPLPQTILYSMRYLRRTAMDDLGIFRKSGVRSRIQQLKRMNEENPDSVNYEGMMSYDVADMLKQYFRELPEPLLTSKLSETFITIFKTVPKELRLQAVQSAIMLMPDENREVLQSLLLFLSDVAQHSDKNQMTSQNLAVCFAPSLFHMCGTRPSPNNPLMSPQWRRKPLGKPDQKELSDNIAAKECLSMMINEVKKLFVIPHDTMYKCQFSYMEIGEPVDLRDLGRNRNDSNSGYKTYIETSIQGLMKEARDKFRGWVSCPPVNNTEISYKKVGDGHPLRLWKCCTEVEAPPTEVLSRIVDERRLWDEDFIDGRVVEKFPDNQTEVYQYVVNSMAPHPSRDYCVLRSWKTRDLPHGTCVLVSTSVKHPDATLLGGQRATILASRFLIEPCGSGKSRLTHICRVDTGGRSVEWYNKSFGHLVANELVRIRDSLKQHTANHAGPETKV